MPVRKIPKNHLVVTGAFSSAKSDRIIGFESTLEKEHMLLLDFDDEVADYDEQPVRVPVAGVRNGYVVDVLVRFRSPSRVPELVEVKTVDDLARKRDEYKPKFAAATAFCEERGWKFVIKTDEEIRTARLKNIKFLRRYRNFEPSPEQTELVTGWVAAQRSGATSEAVLDALASSADGRSALLPVIWNLLLTKQLHTNLDVEMPVDVPIWLPGEAP